jgi:hypothetical protein
MAKQLGWPEGGELPVDDQDRKREQDKTDQRRQPAAETLINRLVRVGLCRRLLGRRFRDQLRFG